MLIRSLITLSALAALATSAAAAPLDAPAAKASIDRGLDGDYPRLEALYKDLHAHPELGFQETATAAKLAGAMRALGFTVTEHVGQTGLVAIYANGPGPTVLVRTELDALPMEEKTGLPYASRAKGLWKGAETFIDHSCGHDVHMTIWLGAARSLLAMKDRWRGRLMFIAQPAEETGAGAKAMLAEGLFTRFPKPDYAFALHDLPLAYGEVAYRPGVATSAADAFTIVFTGRGGHGSMPHTTLDPVMMAARFIVDVQSVVSREKDPGAFGVVTIGAVNAGSAGNIIPDSATLLGTIRSFDPAVREALIAGVRRTAEAVAAMAGAPSPEVTVSVTGNSVINDPALTERTAGVFKIAFGEKAKLSPQPWYPSEDFSEYAAAGVPSLYFNIGIYDPARVAEAKAGGAPLPSNHSPKFAPVPEPTIRTGIEAMTLAVMNVLAR
jgi:hippurate hydrolase